MGNCSYCSDGPKTDMVKLIKNEYKNDDFTKIKEMIKNENKEKQEELNLEKTFRFLKVKKVYLGFNSATKMH